MSNQLHFPLRIYEDDSSDEIILMVPHEDKQWSNKDIHKERTNKTRLFCNWIRKQFPDIPTEFRFVNRRLSLTRRRSYGIPVSRWVGCDKHFVIYGLTKNQLMMTKLAWQFETQKVQLNGDTPYENSSFIMDKALVPSPALRERMNKKIKSKTIDTL